VRLAHYRKAASRHRGFSTPRKSAKACRDGGLAVTVNYDEVADVAQLLADLRAAAAGKPDVTTLILAILSHFPRGLATREVNELAGMTSYNTSAKLSKLAAKGVIEKITVAGGHRHRWRVKPPARRVSL
jgi:hypothetical protein